MIMIIIFQYLALFGFEYSIDFLLLDHDRMLKIVIPAPLEEK